MAEPDAKAAPAGGAAAGPSKPQKPPNPVWKMMGEWPHLILYNSI